MARMDATVAGSAMTQVESELARVQNAPTVSKEARRKAEDKASRLAAERVSLLLELGTYKDEVSAIQTGCRTRLSRYPQSSLLTLNAPRVLSLLKLRPSMFVLVKRRMHQKGRLPL